MFEKKRYLKNYSEKKFYSEYPKITEYIQRNFRKDDAKLSNEDNTQLRYAGFDEIEGHGAHIVITLQTSKSTMKQSHKSLILIEQTGPTADKESSIEKMLKEKGFKRVEEK
jgi:hypothetical protein